MFEGFQKYFTIAIPPKSAGLMDISSTVATWLSLAATIIGLTSVITHFRTAITQADPFHTLRDIKHLGVWWSRQPYVPWYRIIKPPLIGPIICANLLDGLCGQKTINVSRLPLTKPVGQAAWAVLLSVLHQAQNSEIQEKRHHQLYRWIRYQHGIFVDIQQKIPIYT